MMMEIAYVDDLKNVQILCICKAFDILLGQSQQCPECINLNGDIVMHLTDGVSM